MISSDLCHTCSIDVSFLTPNFNKILPAFILWFGWYGFNTGSAISITGQQQAEVVSLVAVNTTLAAASACAAALVVNYFIEERKSGEGSFSLSAAMNGTLGGLVSITGGCAVIEPRVLIHFCILHSFATLLC